MTADLNIALGAMEFGPRIDEATSFGSVPPIRRATGYEILRPSHP